MFQIRFPQHARRTGTILASDRWEHKLVKRREPVDGERFVAPPPLEILAFVLYVIDLEVRVWHPIHANRIRPAQRVR
jgi:hypothetical protein